jgi:hypothetical protein
MAKQIKILDLHHLGVASEAVTASKKTFDVFEKTNLKNLSGNDINYLAIHIWQPFDIKYIVDNIPNEVFLLMQQGVVRPLIVMTVEQWDLFNVFSWKQNKFDLVPDFANIPYSNLVRYFTNRSVPEENITWLVPDANWKKDIDFLRSKGYKIACKFIQFDHFLQQMKTVAEDYNIQNRNFKKHFSCLCRGKPRNHRYGMIYKLWQQKLFEFGNVSCEKFHNLIESKNSNLLNDDTSTEEFMSRFDNWQTDRDRFTEILPLTYDGRVNAHWQMDQYQESKIFEESFLWISNETKKTHTGVYITEKTWKSIAYGNPFCINGDSGSLAQLHEMGFKTFGDFWDESYDTDSDISKIDKISNIVKMLSTKTLPELDQIYVDMLPILKYNQQHLRNHPQRENLTKALRYE